MIILYLYLIGLIITDIYFLISSKDRKSSYIFHIVISTLVSIYWPIFWFYYLIDKLEEGNLK